MKYLEVVKESESSIYVIITRFCDSYAYWTELKSMIEQINIIKSVIVLDYILMNGMTNRFQQVEVTDGVLGELSYANIKNESKSLFNEYLKSHIELLERSVMSDYEKRMIVNEISKL